MNTEDSDIQYDQWIGTAIQKEDEASLYTSADICCICKMPG